MLPFTFEVPKSIAFGAGTITRLPSALKGLGRRILVLSGARWFEGSGWKRKIADMLDGFRVDYLSCPRGEPSTDGVAALRSQAREFAPEAILAIGGGAVLDTAKALSGVLGLADSVERFLEGVPGAMEISGPCIPWVAVPTTAGTGAEATKNAVLKYASLGVKRSMRSARLLAAAVIVDPDLGAGMPREVTGITGLDALTQLVESYVSVKSTLPVRSLVEGAFLPMLDALSALSDRPADPGLRADAAYGALVSGIALANAGLGAAHGFAAGIGGDYDIPHGLICAVFLPHVLRANAPVIAGSIGHLLAGRAGNGDPVEWLAKQVEKLAGAYGLPADLKAFGIPRDRAAAIVERSAGSSMKGNPRELAPEEKQRILLQVI